MQNKAKTYILLVAVLAIWGVIGFKIIASVNPDTPKVEQQTYSALFSPKEKMSIDTFSIQLSKRDPFLGTLYVKKKPKPKTNKPVESIVWPNIIYHGTVSKQSSKEKIYVFSVNGQQHLVRVGKVADNIRLIKASNTEMTVSFKGVKKTVTKS